ncbi:MAG: hypothetical protein DMD52_09675 [Gemmatimonadetes bacterium]|nr:MAG: hypothetical protein DMD52_09675 [Gemmatimonadota bacterium]
MHCRTRPRAPERRARRRHPSGPGPGPRRGPAAPGAPPPPAGARSPAAWLRCATAGRRAPRLRDAAVGTEGRSLGGHNLAFRCRFFHPTEHRRVVRRITAGVAIHCHTGDCRRFRQLLQNLKQPGGHRGATPRPQGSRGDLRGLAASHPGVPPDQAPSLPGFIVAGALLGPNALGLVSDVHRVEGLAEVGVVLLLFTIGIEFSLGRLREMGRQVLVGGGLQVGLTVAAAAAVAAALGHPWRVALFLGCLIALSSTALVLKGSRTKARSTPRTAASPPGGAWACCRRRPTRPSSPSPCSPCCSHRSCCRAGPP